MGFKSVYRTLQELFPQVDARLLRAAAIEHPKDPDEAVGFILTVGIPHTMEKFDASSAVNDTVGSSAVHDENIRKQPNFDSDSMYGSNHVELPFLSAKDHTVESLDCSIQANVKSVTTELKLEIPGHGCIDDTAFREDIQGLDHANTGELSCLHSIITQSGQVCNTDLLENILEQATDHKKSLHSDMESVINLMKEVEIQENAADQAMKEVGEGGLEVHAKVKELKTMLNRAREANDMHSGEVYGERTILGTEMKELQSRVLALSDVKKKFHSILDVMQRTLEKRLAAAETERISAEQEKYEREESEQKALAEQELIMEKVVQESKILQQEAEENARLREFLVDHGRVVDMLQGEMSVICEDIMLLEEKLDKGIPLSQSVSSEQTSFMVASSGCGSGRKSTDSERLLKHDQDISSVEPLLLGSTDDLTTAFPRNEVLDDGWELFELEDVTR